MRYTKGPWFLDGVEIFPAGGHPATDAICMMSPGQGAELYGNASLIAAAPELLDVLINLKREVVLSDIPNEHIVKLYPFFQTANDVIAKAQGVYL